MRLRRMGAAVTFAILMSGLLAGCAGLRPGQAAVVGDTEISDSEFQDVTHNFCTVLGIVQESQGVPNADVPARTAALTALNILLLGTAAEQLAAQEGIEVTQAEVKQWLAQLPPVFENAPAEQRDEIADVSERIARVNLLIGKLGAGEADDPQAAAAAGQQRVQEYLDEVGYEVESRYGQVLDNEAKPGTGSLSIAVSDEAIRGLDVPEGGTVSEAERCT